VNLPVIQQYFSLITNQQIVLLAMNYQSNEQVGTMVEHTPCLFRAQNHAYLGHKIYVHLLFFFENTPPSVSTTNH